MAQQRTPLHSSLSSPFSGCRISGLTHRPVLQVLWLNNLEKDARYKHAPRSLFDIVQVGAAGSWAWLFDQVGREACALGSWA